MRSGRKILCDTNRLAEPAVRFTKTCRFDDLSVQSKGDDVGIPIPGNQTYFKRHSAWTTEIKYQTDGAFRPTEVYRLPISFMIKVIPLNRVQTFRALNDNRGGSSRRVNHEGTTTYVARGTARVIHSLHFQPVLLPRDVFREVAPAQTAQGVTCLGKGFQSLKKNVLCSRGFEYVRQMIAVEQHENPLIAKHITELPAQIGISQGNLVPRPEYTKLVKISPHLCWLEKGCKRRRFLLLRASIE